MRILTKLQSPTELSFGQSLSAGTESTLMNCDRRIAIVDHITLSYDAFDHAEDPEIIRIDVAWHVLL